MTIFVIVMDLAQKFPEPLFRLSLAPEFHVWKNHDAGCENGGMLRLFQERVLGVPDPLIHVLSREFRSVRSIEWFGRCAKSDTIISHYFLRSDAGKRALHRSLIETLKQRGVFFGDGIAGDKGSCRVVKTSIAERLSDHVISFVKVLCCKVQGYILIDANARFYAVLYGVCEVTSKTEKRWNAAGFAHIFY